MVLHSNSSGNWLMNIHVITQMQDNPVNVEETEASATETNVEETDKFPLLENEKTDQWMVSW